MRIRLRFAKAGKVRFTSHRDVARMWERAVRRVGLPVSYSEGFSPRAKLHFGLALSTGHESIAEYLDVDVDAGAHADALATDVGSMPAILTSALPAGIDATAAAVIPAGTPSLQQAVTSCTWQITVAGAEPPEIVAAIDRTTAAETLVLTRTRKGSQVTDDIRPYVLDLTDVVPTDTGTRFTAYLATQPRGLRISELLSVLGNELVEGRVVRTHQWTLHDGARRELLPLDATSAPHAEKRAS